DAVGASRPHAAVAARAAARVHPPDDGGVDGVHVRVPARSRARARGAARGLTSVGCLGQGGPMVIDVRPAEVFDDVATILGPKNPDSTVCFSLSYRIPSKEAKELRGPALAERVRRLMDEEGPICVLADIGDYVVRMAAVSTSS